MDISQDEFAARLIVELGLATLWLSRICAIVFGFSCLIRAPNLETAFQRVVRNNRFYERARELGCKLYTIASGEAYSPEMAGTLQSLLGTIRKYETTIRPGQYFDPQPRNFPGCSRVVART